MVFYDMILSWSNNLEPQFVPCPLWNASPPESQQFPRSISSLMHIYFGCIMLIRNLLQDTVGDIRIRKLLETSQTLSGLGSSCDTIKRKHHRSHFTTFRGAGRVPQRETENPLIRLDSHFWRPELALMHRPIKSIPLFVYYSF